ncbi:hypothetical protein SPRG_07969 [Saprolegnia parasitica CBS 223.65]|uniref:PARP-type domain-containing protein n=1 Tax=Saprolegnia parasitica (strain CBS 223.65) TaxID=695850 RepID=A0A067CBK4_SAPPC|nr:hypothetical protein SPRG_07969 [Saprolegnia parasitica CBS 223.65]KDO26565.1 hypothetical protein SPRG_07969 [Saprolegnia parasitica CBS 223.65]|eukprot:XP_012202707.1 hypothetical protein SPRG_07969 [Saprolegnia parasitica CBS 223.65]
MPASNPWTLSTLPIIGTAKNDKSTCQSCKQCIPQGAVRVGLIFHHLNGYIALDWHHLTCCETPAQLPHIEGYELLSAQAQEQAPTTSASTSSDTELEPKMLRG